MLPKVYLALNSAWFCLDKQKARKQGDGNKADTCAGCLQVVFTAREARSTAELEIAGRGYQQGVWAPEPPGNHDELLTVTAEYKGGTWPYLHECCFQLLLRNLLSSSSGSRKCTAGKMGASTSPCLSCLLNKPEKMSSDW